MEIASELADTLKLQLAEAFQQMKLTAELYHELSKTIKPVDEAAFFNLTSNYSLFIFIKFLRNTSRRT